MTKEEYREAIDKALTKRTEALQEITRLTLASFSDLSIIDQAEKALEAYQEMRFLKQQMRELYPPTCTCTCSEHGQEQNA